MNERTQYSHIGQYVREHILPTGMSITKAAETLGVGRVALSNFLNGKAGLSERMAVRLHVGFGANQDELRKLQREFETDNPVVSTSTKTYVPPFLNVKANEIEEWSNGLDARSKLAEFLRTLVHSTCSGLEKVNFPGNDDSERHGWDGIVSTSEGNPWVPPGRSGWEFGTNKKVKQKADGDFMKRTATVSQSERSCTTFVFVTPRRWLKKEAWVEQKRSERKWKDVIAWDSNDIEQWLEQSIAGQVWFANQRGSDFRGVKSLLRCWVEWCADCRPSFTTSIFEEAISSFESMIETFLHGAKNKLVRVVADSRKEALAFLYATLSNSEKFTEFLDKAVVFTEAGPLQDLLIGKPGFLPIVASQEVERELAESGCALKGFVVDTRTALREDSDISLEPISSRAFHTALTKMGINEDRISRLARESGKSLTILRRRLSASPTIRSPQWSSNPRSAKFLLSLMLAGAWKSDNESDTYLVKQLIACEDSVNFEDRFNELMLLEDTPVWTDGGFQGVVSKIDILYAAKQWMTPTILKQFMSVAEIVLEERDPSLDLPENKRWAAAMYGKARDISSPLRKGIGESLVLLAVHGERLWQNRLKTNIFHEITQLVRKLLEPLTLECLQSQSSALPLYAEATPDEFLSIFERDLRNEKPVVLELIRPIDDLMFGGSDRVDILNALELLAWNKRWVTRVVELLAQLAEHEPDDNLFNKPSNSLASIFRSWLPQTSISVENRISIFDRLVDNHPNVAWKIAMHQFGARSELGHYSYKPIWRDDATGFGSVSSNAENQRFIDHCIDKCINWHTHSCATFGDLVDTVPILTNSSVRRLQQSIGNWAESASDEERAELREHIRVTLRRKSTSTHTKAPTKEKIRFAIATYDLLEPNGTIWKHAWLFRQHWVPESMDEIDADIDYSHRLKQVADLQLEAIQDVISTTSFKGVLQLAFSGNNPFVVGGCVAHALSDIESRLEFLRVILENGDILISDQHQTLTRGFLQALETRSAIEIVDELRDEVGEKVSIRLLSLSDFNNLVWQSVNENGTEFATAYWAHVRPTWNNHSVSDMNYAVSRLLEVKRVAMAFEFASFKLKQVESKLIVRILSELPFSNRNEIAIIPRSVYHIGQAFKVLNERNALSQREMAMLEFLYVDVFPFNKPNIANLEVETARDPKMFADLISMSFEREDATKKRIRSDVEREQSQKAYCLLKKLSHIPGDEGNGLINIEKLQEWIFKVQEFCTSNGRKIFGDQQIGQLLSNAPIGEDGVWPCAPIREVLETVINEDIEIGFQIGKRNSYGFEKLEEGGNTYRKRAKQYEDWASACDYSYPKVASILRGIAEHYQEHANWRDSQAHIERRVGY